MSEEAPVQPQGQLTIIYLGPVAPHWDVRSSFGDASVIDDFRQKIMARLDLLPPHDPQFRRNRERIVRDAEREALTVDWDLGVPDESNARASN